MSTLSKFSDEQIREITDAVDAAVYVCHINGETGEIILLANDEMLDHCEVSLGDNGAEMALPDGVRDWQKETLAQEKANRAKIKSWGKRHTIIIEKPTPHEVFETMRGFVDKVIPAGRLKEDLEEALLQRRPFRDLNAIIDRCDYREAWCIFKRDALEEYVRWQISQYESSNPCGGKKKDAV